MYCAAGEDSAADGHVTKKTIGHAGVAAVVGPDSALIKCRGASWRDLFVLCSLPDAWGIIKDSSGAYK